MERKGKYMPIWGRYVDIFDKLSAEEMGELFHAMMHYHFDDVEPAFSGALSIYWDFLKPDLDNARMSYEKKVENGRKGGKRSAEARREKKELEATSSKMKEPEVTASKMKQTQQRTGTESRTESESITKTESDQGSAPAVAGISVEEKAYGEFGWVKLTDKQYRSLQAKMGEKTLRECIRYIDRSAQSTGNRNRWKDWYLMVLRCYEDGWHRAMGNGPNGKTPIPCGASGELGEAELEAIRRVLAQDIPEDTSPEGIFGREEPATYELPLPPRGQPALCVG